jgi:hypothetical protein
LVAAVLAVGPDGIETIFQTILTDVNTYLQGQIP